MLMRCIFQSPLYVPLPQFTPDDVMKTKKIAAVRIHVERAINHMKQYALVSGVSHSLT